jgi:hypothetical protein
MAGLFDRFRRRSTTDAAAQARAEFQRASALHQDYMQAPAPQKIPQLLEAMQAYQHVLTIFTERTAPEA